MIASLFIGNLFLLLLNLPLAPVWAKLLRTPRPYLYAGILFFASMGAYAVNGSNFDLILLLLLGLLGFVMRRFGLPVLPLIVAVILGPRVELQGRRALQLSSGDWRGLFGSTNVTTGQFELSRDRDHRVRDHRLDHHLAAGLQADQEAAAGQGGGRGRGGVGGAGAAGRRASPRRQHRRPGGTTDAANVSDPIRPRTRETTRRDDHRRRLHPDRPRASRARHGDQPRRPSRARPLVVVNTSRGDALDDPSFAQQADLDWVRATLEEAGVAYSIRQEVRGREAADELLDVLEEVDAELCVIGIRKRTAVGKMLLGSNAHRIIMDAPCPVLTVRADSWPTRQ